MADEKNAKKEKKSFFARVLQFFKLLPGRVASPFKNMWHEMRKVTWPTRQTLTNKTVIVLLFIVFMSVVIGLLDTGASALINLLIS
jgi:preprotein translocase SecE subunit